MARILARGTRTRQACAFAAAFLMPAAALAGCLARFIVHFISGMTVYAQYMPEEFMGFSGMTPFVYSVLYNGTYMLPNTVIAIAVCAALIPVIPRLERR